MKYIEVRKFLKLWERIGHLERETDRGLCLRVGISPAAVSHWRAGKSKTVKPLMIRLIEERLGYKIELRQDGNWDIKKVNRPTDIGGDKNLGPYWNLRRGEKRRDLSSEGKYQIVSDIAALKDQIEFDNKPDDLWSKGGESLDYFWVEVHDSSMEPRYLPGDLVLIPRSSEPSSGDFAVVLWKGAKNYLIRRIFIRDKTAAMAALNPPSDIIPLMKEEILFWAPIVSVSYRNKPHKKMKFGDNVSL